jgi:hypothetical protein
LADALRTNTILTELDLRDNGLGAEGAAMLKYALSKDSNVQILHISGNSVGSTGCASIAKELCKGLEEPAFKPAELEPDKAENVEITLDDDEEFSVSLDRGDDDLVSHEWGDDEDLDDEVRMLLLFVVVEDRLSLFVLGTGLCSVTQRTSTRTSKQAASCGRATCLPSAVVTLASPISYALQAFLSKLIFFGNEK